MKFHYLYHHQEIKMIFQKNYKKLSLNSKKKIYKGHGLNNSNQIKKKKILPKFNLKLLIAYFKKLILLAKNYILRMYNYKNLGILKHSVPEFIKSDNELMSKINNIEEANIEDGGSGAFYIHLKKRKDR